MTTVNEKIAWFKKMEYSESACTEYQFIDMARGGCGEDEGNGDSIRSIYYPYMNDKYFQDVCDGMDWRWR